MASCVHESKPGDAPHKVLHPGVEGRQKGSVLPAHVGERQQGGLGLDEQRKRSAQDNELRSRRAVPAKVHCEFRHTSSLLCSPGTFLEY